jgi:hypothetical protein
MDLEAAGEKLAQERQHSGALRVSRDFWVRRSERMQAALRALVEAKHGTIDFEIAQRRARSLLAQKADSLTD